MTNKDAIVRWFALRSIATHTIAFWAGVLITLFIVMLVFLMSAAKAADLILPDPSITPGVAVEITLHKLCTMKWGKDARKVSQAMKRQVFASYGLKGNQDASGGCRLDKHGRRYEIDHCISRENGGADDVKNLWPECYSGAWNAVMKDRVENRIHKEICAGNIEIGAAQKELCSDWRVPYRRYFGEP